MKGPRIINAKFLLHSKVEAQRFEKLLVKFLNNDDDQNYLMYYELDMEKIKN